MIVRSLKLKPTADQEQMLNQWLWHLTGVYNWAVKKIGNDAKDRIFHSKMDFQNLLAGHSDRLGIPSHTLQGTLIQAHTAWQRCFKKLGKRPHLKGRRNRFNSIPFPDPIKSPPQSRIKIPGLGKLNFHKQALPEGKIKCGRIVHRASGWYLCLWIDAEHVFAVKDTDAHVGIDPGFHSLLTLSDGTKIDNPRELRKGAARLAQAQRAGNKHLSARLLERQANRRRDRNHKISRKLVEHFKTISYSNDNFRGLARMHGKSVSEASLGQLIGMLDYKSRTGGRTIIPVASKNTTRTCSNCRSLTGPSGWNGLSVREWTCRVCGTHHDRDINSAMVVDALGAGTAHKETSNGLN
jgi:transposase